MLVRKSPAETFSVFENPYNLAKITPSWMNFKVVSKNAVEMRAGAEIEYTISWLGLPIHWKTRILEYEPPQRFVDSQEGGPYALWRHTHTFTASDEGTLVRDHVDYALPFAALGQLAHSLIVKRQLLQIFGYRQKQLSRMFGGNTLRTLQPVVTATRAIRTHADHQKALHSDV
jgi:ligand-binding SRPBCC domain-containing protein